MHTVQTRLQKDVIGQNGDADIKGNGMLLLCNKPQCIMNNFFQHVDLHKYNWCRVPWDNRL